MVLQRRAGRRPAPAFTIWMLAGCALLLLAGCHRVREPQQPAPAVWSGSGQAAGHQQAWGQAPAAPWGTTAPAGPAAPSWARQARAASPWAASPTPWPASPSQLAVQAVAFARGQLGKPYCYGGTGPGCFDCSGLVYAAWRWAGKPIPRTSAAQHDRLAEVALAHLEAGDVVWRPGHVGLYVGDGWVIHAPQTGERVAFEPVQRYRQGLRP